MCLPCALKPRRLSVSRSAQLQSTLPGLVISASGKFICFSVLPHSIDEIVDYIVDDLDFDEAGMLGNGSADSSMASSRSQL
jgi:hypothetical protein